MFGVTGGGNGGGKGAGTLIASREGRVGTGIPKVIGMGRNREKFCAIFCNNRKHQEE